MAQQAVPERQARPAPEGPYLSTELDWLEQHQDELEARRVLLEPRPPAAEAGDVSVR